MNVFKKIFKKNNENIVAVASVTHTYKITGVSMGGFTCQTTIEARNEAEARQKVMKSHFTEARGYLNTDNRDYSVHFMRIISVVRL